MNIIFLRSGYGKPDSRLEKEIAAAIEAGHQVCILAWNRDSNRDEKHELDIFDYRVNCIHIGVISQLSGGFQKNLLPMCKFNYRLYKYLRKYKDRYDLIHASDFDTVLPAYALKKRYSKKLVYDIYDYYVDSHHLPSIVRKFIQKIDVRIINHSDAVIICNEKRREQIKPANPSNLYIIHNSPEASQIREAEADLPPKKKFRIVFIGGITGTGRYIFEMIDVIKNRKDCELVIGGFGSGEEEIRKISRENENILFIGKQPYQNVLSIEATADVLTALYDPTLKNHRYAAPNKFYEALMLGKPLICAKNTYIDEIVEREKLGWVLNVPQKEFESEFHRALDLAVGCTSDEYSRISKAAKKIFAERYDWKIMKDVLAKVYCDAQG